MLQGWMILKSYSVEACQCGSFWRSVYKNQKDEDRWGIKISFFSFSSGQLFVELEWFFVLSTDELGLGCNHKLPILFGNGCELFVWLIVHLLFCLFIFFYSLKNLQCICCFTSHYCLSTVSEVIDIFALLSADSSWMNSCEGLLCLVLFFRHFPTKIYEEQWIFLAIWFV